MLIIDNQKYTKNTSEFIASLFGSGGTCVGFYKETKAGITLFDIQKQRIEKVQS